MHKTIFSGKRISWMVQWKWLTNILWVCPRKVILKIGLIVEDDLLRIAKSGKMTYRERQMAKKIQEDDLPRLAQFLLLTSRNFKSGFDWTESLKPSSRDKRFQLVVSRKWLEFLNWLPGKWKTLVSHFDWTKPSRKSLNRTKWFCVDLVRLYHKNLI